MSLSPFKSESAANAFWRLIVRLALVAAAVYGCYRLRAIIVTLCVAAIIAYMLDPIVEWLTRSGPFVSVHSRIGSVLGSLSDTVPAGSGGRASRRRLRRHGLRLIATSYVFVLALVALWQGGKLVITPFAAEFRAALSPEGRRQAREHKEHLLEWYDQHAPEWARSEKIQNQILKSDAMQQFQRTAGIAAAQVIESLRNIVELLLLPVLAFYFLTDGRQLKHEFVALLPRSRIPETMRMLREFNRIMRAFIVGQFLLCVIAGVVVGSGLALLHVNYPIILGVFAGLTRAIPIIGPILGGIPIVVLTLATKGWTVALAVLGFFTLLHFVESKFVMPLLIGDRMDLHPVVIIVVLLIGGEVGGLVIGTELGALLGMFFAAPLAAIGRVMVRRYWLRIRSRPAAAGDRSTEQAAVKPAEPLTSGISAVRP